MINEIVTVIIVLYRLSDGWKPDQLREIREEWSEALISGRKR